MTRAAYAAERRHERDSRDSREDRGLPHHPVWGWLQCPECKGAGCFTDSESGDPQDECDIRCERCDGEGGWYDMPRPVDPLLRMREYRKMQSLTWQRRERYRYARLRAMRPCSGLAEADMRAWATRCATAANSAASAWSKAA